MEFKIKNNILIPVNTTKPSYLKDNINGNVFHDTYLDYLYHSYANHYGIEVKPDFIWFTILSEISRTVRESPNEYREIFTDSQAKKEISVYTMDPIVMPIDDLLESAFKHIPPGLKKDDIVLDFSTSTPSSKLAFSTSFLEASSPYYCYSMFRCGFNKINVLGNITDYELMKQSLIILSDIFSGKKIINYFNKVITVINNIIENFDNVVHWENIFYVESCGSGSQEEVYGWFQELFNDFDGYKFMKAFPKHCTSIEYKNLSTNLSYKMSVGIFSSTIDDGYLKPDFEFGINQI